MARQRRQGKGDTPAPGHVPFGSSLSAPLALLDLTTSISSSPELALPSTLAPDRHSASSRRVLSREARPPGLGEVSLSQGLRTAGLLWPHALVEYRWSHTGLCPGSKSVIICTSAASCHNPHRSRLARHAHPVPHLMTSLPARSVVVALTRVRSLCTCHVSLIGS